jgi:hypothetical protein
MAQGEKTTAQSTTEQPETQERERLKPDKRTNHSARRMREQQRLEQVKRQYNRTGSVEDYTDIEDELT